MNITPVCTTNQNSFQGRLIMIKPNKWPDTLLYTMERNQDLFKKLTDGYDVVVRLSKRTSHSEDLNHYRGQKLYKIKISLVKEGSKIAKFLDSLHLLPRRGMTYSYHSEAGAKHSITPERIKDLEKYFI
ncbi:hypothetical protein IJ556_00750 [bacterium]|nr:hypothetical protein [bacterium]